MLSTSPLAAENIDRLYKYGRFDRNSEISLDRASRLFSTPTVWLSPPSAMNDPFECRPSFTFNGTPDQFVTFMVKEIGKRRPELPFTELLRRAHLAYSQGAHRDPKWGLQFSEGLANDIQDSIGMCCFSESPDNILMWSHYAVDHKGYCIEFEAASTTEFFGAAQRVRYSSKYPSIDFFNTPRSELVDLLVLTKYEDWKYEKEWRIIDHTTGPGYKSYPREKLVSVTFGMRMDDEDRLLIRKWLALRGHQVALYQASRTRSHFGITRERID